VLHRALDHTLGRQHLGLTDRRRRFDIDDDRVVDIDQIVGRVGKEGRSTAPRSPPRCRISGRDELGCYLSCSTKRRIIKDGEIFLDGAAGRVRRQTSLASAPGSG